VSDDIVDRLAVIAAWPFDITPRDCSIEAVDATAEILALRTRVAELEEQVDEMNEDISNCRVLEWHDLADQLAEALRPCPCSGPEGRVALAAYDRARTPYPVEDTP